MLAKEVTAEQLESALTICGPCSQVEEELT
jgi:hypothetical protein